MSDTPISWTTGPGGSTSGMPGTGVVSARESLDRWMNDFSVDQRAKIYYTAFLGAQVNPDQGVGAYTLQDRQHVMSLLRYGYWRDKEAQNYVRKHGDAFNDWQFNREVDLNQFTENNFLLNGYEISSSSPWKVATEQVDGKTVFPSEEERNAYEGTDDAPMTDREKMLALGAAAKYVEGGGETENIEQSDYVPVPGDYVPISEYEKMTSPYALFEDELGFNPWPVAAGIAATIAFGYAGGFGLAGSIVGRAMSVQRTWEASKAWGLLHGGMLGYSTYSAGAMAGGSIMAWFDAEDLDEDQREAIAEAERAIAQMGLDQEDMAFMLAGDPDMSLGEAVGTVTQTANQELGIATEYPVSQPASQPEPTLDPAKSFLADPWTGRQLSGPGAYSTTSEPNPDVGEPSLEDAQIAAWATENVDGWAVFFDDNPTLAMDSARQMFLEFRAEEERIPWVGENVAGSPIRTDTLETWSDRLQYNHEDKARILDNLTPGQYDTLVQGAVAAGLLPEKYVATGVMDSAIAGAMEQILYESNLSGEEWTDQLELLVGQYAEMKALDEEENPYAMSNFVPSSAYLALDPATAEQSVKGTMRSMLGREANDWEVQMLARQMETTHRQAYDVQLDNEKGIWEAKGRAYESDDPVAAPAPLQAVDEQARFAEQFEERYSVEIDERERWDGIKRDSANLFSGLSKISQSMGGV